MVTWGLCYTLHMAYPIGHRGSVDKRFWSKVEKSSCWEWQAAKDKQGYGRFRVSPDIGTKLAHHVSLWLLNGEWPDGIVMHSCDNPSCVRPAHLIAGATIGDNNRDMVSKGRQANQLKTHCPRGHPYDEGNTLSNHGTGRRCRECHRADSLARYHRNRES